MSIYAELRNRIMRKIMKYYENFAFFLNNTQFWRFLWSCVSADGVMPSCREKCYKIASERGNLSRFFSDFLDSIPKSIKIFRLLGFYSKNFLIFASFGNSFPKKRRRIKHLYFLGKYILVEFDNQNDISYIMGKQNVFAVLRHCSSNREGSAYFILKSHHNYLPKDNKACLSFSSQQLL